jgi:membrane associated rhomboid family serine protease
MSAEEINDTTPAVPQATTAVRWLIALSVAAYFLQLTVVNAATVRAGLGFEMDDLDGAWWTIATYMFVHTGLLHLVVSMYALWLFGPQLETRWGSGQFASYYLLCGLGGWFAYLLFVRGGVFIGSTAAVLGVMLAHTATWPTDRLVVAGIAPAPTRWVAAIAGVAIVVIGASAEGVGYLAHVGGLATAWLYLRMAGAMDIEGIRRRIAPIVDEPEDMPPQVFPRSVPRPREGRDARPADEIVAQSQAAVAERPLPPRRARAEAIDPAQSDLNLLLDKISAEGFGSLTEAERTRLEDAARKLRDR